MDYEVMNEAAADWLILTGTLQGTLDAGETADITVEVNENANLLEAGAYPTTIQIINNSGHIGDTEREVILIVGAGEIKYEWTFDEDPGWTASRIGLLVSLRDLAGSMALLIPLPLIQGITYMVITSQEIIPTI